MAHNNNLFKLNYFMQLILVYKSYLTREVNLLEVKGNLPDPSVISKIINEFFGPVMRSVNGETLEKQETVVDKTIREKIEELRPLLQDEEVTSNDENLTLEDKDDTTIIEFLPKTEARNKEIEDDSFKSKLKKYKKIREKINKALSKESVSVKTKNLVTKTLDGLIKYLLSSQCKWKRNLRAVKSENSSDIAKKWNKGLQNIKDVLLSFIQNRSVQTKRSDDVLKFLDAIQIMFRKFTEDVDVISKTYKVLCNFVPKENNYAMHPEQLTLNALRNNWDETDLEEDRCHNVVVCSNELKEFMRNFYLTLNDTAVSVFKNYVEMYTRDVNFDDENEKIVIISLINNMTNDLAGGIIKCFVRETQKLELNEEKQKLANVNNLSNYVKNTIKSVKNYAKELMKSELLMLREKILSVIMNDLSVNLDVDLGNLEREFIGKICAMFRLCNGKYRGRRQGTSNLNKNNLYVQVRLTLNNDTTDMNNNNSYRKFLKVVTRNNTDNRFTTSMANVTVTRTTLINNVTKGLFNNNETSNTFFFH